MKKIVKVMVFYDDGTFDECNASTPTLTYPPGVRSPAVPDTQLDKWIPKTKQYPCVQCGEVRTGYCGKLQCPNGHINPWDNGNKVID